MYTHANGTQLICCDDLEQTDLRILVKMKSCSKLKGRALHRYDLPQKILWYLVSRIYKIPPPIPLTNGICEEFYQYIRLDGNRLLNIYR